MISGHNKVDPSFKISNFQPEKSQYHSILLKMYGREKAIAMLKESRNYEVLGKGWEKVRDYKAETESKWGLWNNKKAANPLDNPE